MLAVADVSTADNGGTDGYFIYDNAGLNAGTIYWDATGGSGSDAVAFAKITAGSALQPTDFHVVADTALLGQFIAEALRCVPVDLAERRPTTRPRQLWRKRSLSRSMHNA